MKEYVQLSWQMTAMFFALILYIIVVIHSIKVMDYFFPKANDYKVVYFCLLYPPVIVLTIYFIIRN